jgi:hypothetical protein
MRSFASSKNFLTCTPSGFSTDPHALNSEPGGAQIEQIPVIVDPQFISDVTASPIP